MIKIDSIYIFYGILIGVLFMQYTLGKPIDDDKINKSNQTINTLIHIFNGNSTEYYTNRTVNTTRHILKDHTVIANHNREVEEFKLNLTTILNNYDAIKNDADTNGELKNSTAKEMAYLERVMSHFINITEYYFELPVDNLTTDSKFIVDKLKQYGGYDIYMELKAVGEFIAHIFARALAEALFGWMKPNRD